MDHRLSGSVDPPPDLVVEVEITRSALDRMSIYAALGVGEIWRYDGERLSASVLDPDGKYRQVSRSRSFPFLPIADLVPFLERARSEDVDETTLMRSFQEWVRTTLSSDR